VTLTSGRRLTVGSFARIGDAGAHSSGSATVAVDTGSVFDVKQSLCVFSGGTVALNGGSVSGADTSGTVDVAAGGSISGHGVLSVGDGTTLIDYGSVTATGGTLEIGASILGVGALHIDAGSTAKIDGSSVSLASIAFDGPGGTLSLATGAAVTSSITGFTFGDQISMAGVDKAVWSAAKGTLTLTDQGHAVDTLHLGGSYAGDLFDVQQSHNGTVITLHAH
jgi:fibronectin-binding autotransporter adhesin